MCNAERARRTCITRSTVELKTAPIAMQAMARIPLSDLCPMVNVTAPRSAPQKKSFLFLQGVSSPFFKHLAYKLEQDGHQVHKVNFNGGDVAYWAPRTSHWFRGAPSELPSFLAEIYRKFAITDQVLFGDRRPVHQRAVEAARQLDSV